MEDISKNQSLYRRFVFAMRGIIGTFKSEASFKSQLGGMCFAIPFLIYFKASPIWYALFGLVTACVLSVELINTALEKLADKVEPKFDPVIGAAKDCAAGAVFILSIGAMLIFVAFLFEHVN